MLGKPECELEKLLKNTSRNIFNKAILYNM